MSLFCTPRIVTLGVQNGQVVCIAARSRIHLRATARTAIARLAIVETSVCLSVCLSVTLCDCIKTVQARIMKSLLWAASIYFTAICLSRVKTVADRRRNAFVITSTDDELLVV